MEERNTSQLSLWYLSWPIAIEMLLQFLMGTVDTLMVSHIGDQAVSAVGISNQVVQSALTLFSLINAGVGVVVARKWGAGRKDDARRTAIIALKVNVLVGLAASLFFYFFSGPVLHIMHTPKEVYAFAYRYLSIVGTNTLVVVLHTVINSIVRNTGNTRGPMYITIGMNLLHLLINYSLIFGAFGMPRLGIAGAAVSTLISRGAALAVSFALLLATLRPIFRWKDWKENDRELFGEILEIGLPVSVTAISWGYSQIVLISIVSSLGSAPLAAYTYLQTIQQFPWIIASAIGTALQIRVAQFYGARRIREVYYSMHEALKPGLALIFAVALLIAVSGRPLLAMFTDNQEIIRLSMPILALCVLWQPLRIIAFCTSNSLNVVGEARIVALLSVFGMWVVAAGGAYLFGKAAGLGLAGIFYALILDEAVRGSVFVLRWLRRKPQAMLEEASSL